MKSKYRLKHMKSWLCLFKSDILGYLLTFFIYYWLCAFLRSKNGITIFAYDTFGGLALPAKIMNYDWSYVLKQSHYYGPGTALWYIPIFKLCHDPIIIYNVMYNVLIAFQTAAAVILYYLLDKYVSPKKHLTNVVAAIIGTYFTNFVIKDTALLDVEHLITLLTVLLAVIICKLCEARSFNTTALLALGMCVLCIYALCVHIRNIVFIIGILSAYFYVLLTTNTTSILRKNEARAFVLMLLALMIAFYKIIPRVFQQILFSNHWDATTEKYNMDISVYTEAPINEFLLGVLFVLVGNVYQSIKQTHGIIIISFIIAYRKLQKLYRCVRTKQRHNEINYTDVLFIFSTSMYLCGLIGTAIHLAGHPMGSGYWRYYGCYTVIMISISLVFFAQDAIHFKKRHVVIAVLLASFKALLMIREWITSRYLVYWFIFTFLQDERLGVIGGTCITFFIVLFGVCCLLQNSRNKIRLFIVYLTVAYIIPVCRGGSIATFGRNSLCDIGHDVINELVAGAFLSEGDSIYFTGTDASLAYYQYMALNRRVTKELPEDDQHIVVFSDLPDDNMLPKADGWVCLQLDDNEYAYSKDKSMVEVVEDILNRLSQ